MNIVDLEDERPRTFEARYSGRCTSCGEHWEEGDEIAYVDDELVCEWCLD